MDKIYACKIRSWGFSGLLPVAVAFVAMAWCAPAAYGWGAGHSTQAQMVVDGLPKEIRDFLGDQNCKDIIGGPNAYCGFPDNPQMKEELLGKEALAEFKRMKMTAGALHEDVNAAVAFDLLCMAFAEKNPKHAAVWVGALTHAMGDNTCHMAQTAYVPVICRFKNIKCSEGYSDLSSVMSTEFGKKKLKELMAGYKPKAIATDPDDALVKLVFSTVESQDHGAQMQSGLCATFNVSKDPSKPGVPEEGITAMAQSGEYGSKGILDAVVTAWQFAKDGKKVELTDEQIKKGRALSEKFCATKPLANDSIFVGTLDSKPEGAAVGVLLENSTYMGSANFMYCGCVVLSQVMRAFQEAKVPYLPLDLRKVVKDGLPPVDKMPVLVISTGGYNWQQDVFTKYVKAGGKILCIAGRDSGLLGKLSASLKDADRKLLPVGVDYEDAKHEGEKAVARVSVKFLEEWGKEIGADPMKFVNNPNTAGWTTQHCDVQIVSADPDLKVLAAVTDGEKTMNIAAALLEKGKARHVFIPQYLLLPFVLSHDETMDFAKPTFDSTGKKIILSSAKMLAPELMAKEK